MSKFVMATLLSAVVLCTSPSPGQALQNPPRTASIGVNGVGSGVNLGRGGYYGGGYYGGGYYGGGYYGNGYAPYYRGYYGYSPYYYSYDPSLYGAPRAAYYYGPGDQGTGAATGSPAEIDVLVPKDAELFLDGAPTKQQTGTRTFVSPPLPLGQTFTYEFRARWTQDGKPVDVTRQIDVRSGAKLSVDLRKQ